MHANMVNRMLMGTALFVSLLITLCLALYNDERQTIYKEEIKVAAGDVDVKVDVSTAEPLGHIEDYFISFDIDSQEFIEHFEKMNFRLLYFLAFVCCFYMIHCRIFDGAMYRCTFRLWKTNLGIFLNK